MGIHDQPCPPASNAGNSKQCFENDASAWPILCKVLQLYVSTIRHAVGRPLQIMCCLCQELPADLPEVYRTKSGSCRNRRLTSRLLLVQLPDERLGRTSAICTPNPLYLSLGNNTPARLLAYRKLFKAHIDDDITLIRDATNKGLAIGNDRFVKQVELLSGRRVTEKKRGPKSEAETE